MRKELDFSLVNLSDKRPRNHETHSQLLITDITMVVKEIYT